jgi:hypothetical protein
VKWATVGIPSDAQYLVFHDTDYGFAETAKEGFGEDPKLKWPSAFVEFFCKSHKGVTPETEITRIEFEYV